MWKAAVVGDEYGLIVDGIRYDSPKDAADAATNGDITDGWRFGTEIRPTEKGRSRSSPTSTSNRILRIFWTVAMLAVP